MKKAKSKKYKKRKNRRESQSNLRHLLKSGE